MKRSLFVIYLMVTIQLFASSDTMFLSSESIEISSYTEAEYIAEGYVVQDSYNSGLDIYSEIEDLILEIDGKVYSSDTLVVENMDAGIYYLEISSEGYRTYKSFIQIYSDKRTVIEITLAREYGFLNIETNSDNYQLYLNDIEIDGTKAIPTGSYELKIRSFGFIEYYRDINITADVILNLEIELELALFTINRFTLNKEVINPFAKEGFSTLNIEITVNAPGEATLNIFDSNKNSVSIQKLTFNTWDTRLTLDKDYLLPTVKGQYTVMLSYNDSEISHQLEIDDSLQIVMLNNSSTFTGLLHAPTAEINDISVHQSDFNVRYNVTDSLFYIPISYKYNFSKYLQLLTGMSLAMGDDKESINITAYSTLKAVKKFHQLSTALNCQYMFNQFDTNHHITINTPLTLELNQFNLTLTPSYTFNNDMTIYSGFHYDNQMFRTGISGEFSGGEIKGGIEFWKLLKNSQTYWGLSLSIEESNIITAMGISTLY